MHQSYAKVGYSFFYLFFLRQLLHGTNMYKEYLALPEASA